MLTQAELEALYYQRYGRTCDILDDMIMDIMDDWQGGHLTEYQRTESMLCDMHAQHEEMDRMIAQGFFD